MRFSKISLLILIFFIHAPVLLPAQVQLHLRCWLDIPREQLRLHTGQRRVQPLACALFRTCAVFQHSRLFLLWGLSHGYVGMSMPATGTMMGSACQPGMVPDPVSFCCPRIKKPVLRRGSNPALCPISLTPSPDHLPAVTGDQKKWEVCPKLCLSQTLGAGLAIVCEVKHFMLPSTN